jgi:hypothetical protein
LDDDRDQSGATGEAVPDSKTTDPVGDAIGGAVAQLQEVVSQLRRLIDVQVDRARVRTREAAFRIALWGLAFVAGSALMVVATFFLVRGVSGLIAELTERTWAGDLLGGLLILLLLWSSALIARGWLRRRGLARLKRRYEEREEAANRD